MLTKQQTEQLSAEADTAEALFSQLAESFGRVRNILDGIDMTAGEPRQELTLEECVEQAEENLKAEAVGKAAEGLTATEKEAVDDYKNEVDRLRESEITFEEVKKAGMAAVQQHGDKKVRAAIAPFGESFLKIDTDDYEAVMAALRGLDAEQ